MHRSRLLDSHIEVGTVRIVGRSVKSSGSESVRVSEVPEAFASAPATTAATIPAARLTRLKADTGLTWDQIARLFGVSRRAVHQWAVGGRMSSANTELLALLERTLVTDVPAVNTLARRTSVFAADPTGQTPFERGLGLRATQNPPVSGNALTALEQVSFYRELGAGPHPSGRGV